MRVGKKFWNFQRQGGNEKFLEAGEEFFRGGNQIFLDQAGGGTHDSNAKIILNDINSKVKSEISKLIGGNFKIKNDLKNMWHV